MVDALQTILPTPSPVHHLGLFRDKSSLQPIEYYNNLPSTSNSNSSNPGPVSSSQSSTAQQKPHGNATDAGTTPAPPFQVVPTSRAGTLTTEPTSEGDSPQTKIAILLDPVLATGGTSSAAIQTLREAGFSRILLLVILASHVGLQHTAKEWPEGVKIHVGAVDDGVGVVRIDGIDGDEGRGQGQGEGYQEGKQPDEEGGGGLNEKGMIVPGLGDIGDRLFGT
ncbi:MAG: hypothetical protein M1823_002414 [Watsoniomyces obsoletus]|nr:MAG: hypothetical protein M1823_002414 [Watsoniomyces obsoletus]